jgi:hypothetical protein
MQTVIQVIATGTGSLREKIMTDPQLGRFDLIPSEHQRPGRPHGWAKIHSETAHGAINLEWHGRSRTLICRVVTKLGNKPNSIIGDFVDYLLARIKAVFSPFTSCADELAVRFAASLGVNHSTVTLLARLRGLSTSRPSATATMIRQKLEWDDGENRHHVIRRFRQDRSRQRYL